MSRSHSSLLHVLPVQTESRFADAAIRLAAIVAATALVAVCAHVAIPLPMTPVPFTLQPFAVLLVGMLLGPWAGFAAMALYLAEGAAGLPVFTPAGLPGVARLLGPTGGYLFAYPLAAALAGGLPALFAKRRFPAFALAGAVAMLLVYACGAAWFSLSLHLPLAQTLQGTVLPFAASDAVKVLAAAGIASALSRRG